MQIYNLSFSKFVYSFCIFGQLVTSQVFALSSHSYWRCDVIDQLHQHWTAQHYYERLARAHAFDGCKKTSSEPKSCKLMDNECEFFTNGISHRPLWQCTAFDQPANKWVGKPRRDRYAAVFAAKERCQIHSPKPESCYVNLITCTNSAAKN